MIVILNPDYSLKNDLKRVCLFSRNSCIHNGRVNWRSFIHPMQGILLSLFSHGYDFEKCILDISTTFGIDAKSAQQLVLPFIENETVIWTEYEGKKILFLENLLIRTEETSSVNLEKFKVEEFFCKELDLQSERFLRAPHTITIMLNNHCVTKCKYCYADIYSKYNPLSDTKIFDIIGEAKRLNLKAVNLIGGEVFLHKSWKNILTELVSSNLSPEYLSTKVPLTEIIIKDLISTGYKGPVQLSLDSVKDTTLQKVIGTPTGYIERFLKGIRLLDEAGFDIQINTVLTRENSTIEEINLLHNAVQTIRHLNYWEIRIPNKPLPSNPHFKKIAPQKKILQELYKYIENEIKPNTDVTIKTDLSPLNKTHNTIDTKQLTFDGGLCGALHSFLFILPDGKTTVCEELYWHPAFLIGDLTVHSLEEIWQSTNAKKLRDELFLKPMLHDTCKSCTVADWCITNHRRCWTKIIRAYGSSGWNFPDPRCIKAPYIPEFYNN